MYRYKRVFLIVMDSLGIGAMPDSDKFGDFGVDTLGHIAEKMDSFTIPNLRRLGMANLKAMDKVDPVESPLAYYAPLREKSNGKDTMTGHWEMMGIETTKPFITFTEHGFPPELIKELRSVPVAISLATRRQVVRKFWTNWVRKRSKKAT